MSDLNKASQDATDAAANSEQVALILAVLQAQQITQAQQTPVVPPPAPRASGSAAQWIGIGIGGSALLLTIAVSAVAVAISAVALTICALVLRSVWQDINKPK
ncbi:hypothetical protein ACIPJM_03030 [Streptomyces halstedii]|uniref:hypothetical protein n=1 Tax=Streptomyces halstedii TaxID=1944 RepID=UPI00381295BB